MLNIFLGQMDDEHYIPTPDTFFDNTYEDSWITDPFSQQMIRDVDHSTVVGPHLIDSPFLGAIPPTSLSGGVKTLMLMNFDQKHIFNASACGDNCAKWILKIAKKQNLTIRLGYFMDFGKEPFEAIVLNNDAKIHSMSDFLRQGAEYI